MYLISLGASEFEPSAFNICKLKNAPPLVCCNEIVSPQCFIPRKTKKRMSNLSSVYYSKILRESCFYYRRLCLFCHGYESDVPLFHFVFSVHTSPIELSATKWDSNLYQSTWTASVWPLNALTQPDPVSCRAPKRFSVKQNPDLSSWLCNCVGNESLRKSVHKLNKKNLFVQRYIFMKIHL